MFYDHKVGLCPHRNVALGNYRDSGVHNVLNSSVIQKYRDSMLSDDTATPMSKECFGHHRTWSIDKLKESCGKLGLDSNNFKTI